jgi:integrase
MVNKWSTKYGAKERTMAITVGKYHLFERERRGRSYFYYWYEEQGKRIQKACGHGCDDKRSAVIYLEQLLKTDLSEAKRKAALASITIKDFAKNMFLEGAPHLARWAAKGKILKRQTIVQHRRHLTGYLLPRFGNLRFTEITPTMIEDFLLEQRLSNSCRNTILYTLKLVMHEARRSGIIEMIPEFEPFKRNGKRQDILSGEELIKLFPFDEKELIEIWKRPDDMRKERPEIALMFGTLFCVTVSAGLRSGEIRALHHEQISFANSGLMIDRAVDDRGEIGPLKKATEEDSRNRAVIIPGITLKMLKRWLDRKHGCPCYPGLVFPYHGKPVANYYIIDRFRYGLRNAGIDYESRRLTVHCLRYTYNTRMRTLLSEQVLREFVGHRSVAMTDHYDRPILLERLAAYQTVKPSVEQFWG